MAYIVETSVTGAAHYLRGTVWTSQAERADKFDTEDSARAAIERSKKFNPRAAKSAKIIPER